jgi:hypothetical protein
MWSWTNEWVNQAKLQSDLQVSMTPTVNSIGCKAAHVAWVIAISTDGATVTVTEQACNGPSGTLTNDHPTSWFELGFISKKGSSTCSAGQTESQACGKCGKQNRTCESSGQWGAWGGCTGEGVCQSGAIEKQPCENSTQRTRKCGSDCQWGEWGPCGIAGDDPIGLLDASIHPTGDASIHPTGDGAVSGASTTTLVGGCNVARRKSTGVLSLLFLLGGLALLRRRCRRSPG